LGWEWTACDYGEKLMPTSDLRGPLQLEEAIPETRKCLLKAVGGALFEAQTGKQASVTDADNVARLLRDEQYGLAIEARAQLGDPGDALVPRAQAAMNVHIHDATTVNHDMDFRILAVFPLQEMQTYTVFVLRIGYWGQVKVELIPGAQAEPERNLFVVIHRGHMRMLRAPRGVSSARWRKRAYR